MVRLPSDPNQGRKANSGGTLTGYAYPHPCTPDRQETSRRTQKAQRPKGNRLNGLEQVPTDAELAEANGQSELGQLGAKTMDELRAIALEANLKSGIPARRSDLVLELLASLASESDQLLGAGVLDVLNDGYGFLRTPGRTNGHEDIYVSQSQINRFGLRQGDMIAGQVRPQRKTSATTT